MFLQFIALPEGVGDRILPLRQPGGQRFDLYQFLVGKCQPTANFVIEIRFAFQGYGHVLQGARRTHLDVFGGQDGGEKFQQTQGYAQVVAPHIAAIHDPCHKDFVLREAMFLDRVDCFASTDEIEAKAIDR